MISATNRNHLLKIFFTFSLFLLTKGTVYAGCQAPIFTEIKNNKITEENTKNNWIKINMRPIPAKIKLPADFSDIFFNDVSTLGFKSNNFRGVFIFEKNNDYILPEENINIYQYYKTLFTSPKDSYCNYLNPHDINSKEHKLYRALTNGEVFAFGGKNIYYIYILSEKNQNLVISAHLEGLIFDDFMRILNSITLEGNL